MSLVAYASSDEDSDEDQQEDANESKAQASVSLPTANVTSGQISDEEDEFLSGVQAQGTGCMFVSLMLQTKLHALY